LFWSDNWIQGTSIRSITPNLWGAVPQRVHHSRTVRDAILDQSWVRDIIGASTVQVIVQYIRVWDLLLDFALTETRDRFIWKWTASGEFSSGSAYRALFFGWSPLLGASHLWKTQAPSRVRFFGWLVLHGRCWTSDGLRHHGLSVRDVCALCAHEVETLDHLLLGCVHSRETWFRVLRFFDMTDLAPTREEPVAVWWLWAWKVVVKPSHKGFDTLVWLVAWSLWKERNRRVHERAALQTVALAGAILEDVCLWARAGFVSIVALLGFCRRVMAP
jgi:hypothetical protein